MQTQHTAIGEPSYRTMLTKMVRQFERVFLVVKEFKYETHLSTLSRLFDRFDVRAVLETRSGKFSTRFFLLQPIEILISLENNPRWTIDSSDSRHDFRLINGTKCEALPKVGGIDLVFIDDDPLEERFDTR